MMHGFTEGFLAHAPGWHGLGEVPDYFPGRAEGMKMAGHNFKVVERHSFLPTSRRIAVNLSDKALTGKALTDAINNGTELHVNKDGVFITEEVPGYKVLQKDYPDEKRPTWLAPDAPWTPTDGMILSAPKESYGVVPNEVGWDVAEALTGEGAQFETGLSLNGGAVCVVLMYLPEPYTVPGDDSVSLPFVCVSWAHDGSAALRAESTEVRVVCMNTLKQSEMLSDARDTAFVWRHTKNVMEHIAEALPIIKGQRVGTRETFIELTNELAKIRVTKRQREIFVQQFIPEPINPDFLTERQILNREQERELLRSIINGEKKTVPDAHRFTGYGLHLSGTEYLDHYRKTRSQEGVFNRSVLKKEPLKAKLTDLIRECAKA